jgi:hypothetical protein
MTTPTKRGKQAHHAATCGHKAILGTTTALREGRRREWGAGVGHTCTPTPAASSGDKPWVRAFTMVVRKVNADRCRGTNTALMEEKNRNMSGGGVWPIALQKQGRAQ